MTSIMPWVNFILFVGILVYFLREPLLDFLGDRSEKIRQALEKIARQKEEVQTRLADYQRRLERAADEIEKLKAEFQREGELEKKNLVQRAQTYAEKIRQDAKRIAEQELRKARHLLRQKAFLLSVELAQKKIEQAINSADQTRLARWGISHLERMETQ